MWGSADTNTRACVLQRSESSQIGVSSDLKRHSSDRRTPRTATESRLRASKAGSVR
jgi:hypothetical protein